MENHTPEQSADAQSPPPFQYAGSSQNSPWGSDGGRKSSALATMLSIMPGLGQVYVGYYQQGFINVLVVGSLIAMLNDGVGSLLPLAGFFLVFYWLYNMVDAGRRASFYNLVLSRKDPAEMETAPLPDDKASLLAGIALVFFGSLFLGHTVFGFSMEWLEDWWPLGLVILGLYLIFQAVTDAGSRKAISH